jgi:uncharacterized membrane protein
MSIRAAITVNREPEEVQRLWRSGEYPPEFIAEESALVDFKPAPGDRGTEIHVAISDTGQGVTGRLRAKLGGTPLRAKAMDDLRRFKQLVEAGEIARSEATPTGELAERKLKQRPAQPLDDGELEEVQS